MIKPIKHFFSCFTAGRGKTGPAWKMDSERSQWIIIKAFLDPLEIKNTIGSWLLTIGEELQIFSKLYIGRDIIERGT